MERYEPNLWLVALMVILAAVALIVTAMSIDETGGQSHRNYIRTERSR